MRLLAALLLVCLAPVGFLYPVFTRPDQGWPTNPGKGLREVGTPSSRIIAPGDTVRVFWTPEGVESVGALWSGIPKVEVLNAVETGCPRTLPATGRIETWNRVIWTKSSLQECPPFLTARFQIPDDDGLIGKTLKFRITLPFIYPAPEGRSRYVDKKKTVVRQDDVLLTSSSVKAAYWTSWKLGATIGMTGTAVGGFMLVLLAVGMRGGWAATRDALGLASSQNQAQARADRLRSAMDSLANCESDQDDQSCSV